MQLDIRYHLEPCPPCAAVDEPANAAEWRQVRKIELRVVTRSISPRPQGGGFVRIEGSTAVRPRNLI
jgi:hypothetical protein